MDGVLNIDKPPDLTSHDVVSRVRHILHERRIGHTGTLDPFATGVLVVLVGRATRVAQFLSGVDKEYEAVIRLGYATDTGDRTGNPINAPSDSAKLGPWSEAEVETALAGLRGYVNQTPPMYSAKKKNGQRLYELARRGEEVGRQPVRVCVHEFVAIRPNGELMKDNLDGTYDFQVRVVCSSGTYIRTLAEDLGKRLNVGAHLAELRRTRVGDLTIDGAITLDDLKTRQSEDALGTVLLTPGTALSRLPFVHLSLEDARKARNGMEVTAENTNWPDETKVRMYDAEGQLIAIGDFDRVSGRLHPRVVIAREE